MKKLLTILTITAIVFASCSKTKKLTKRLYAGKWNITKKENLAFFNNQTDVPHTYTNTAAGSIELKSDHTGTFNDPIDASGTIATYAITDWYNDETHVSILLEDQSNPKKVYQWTFDITNPETTTQTWYNHLYRTENSGYVEIKTTYSVAQAK